MRKRLIIPTLETIRSRSEGWLDIKRAAVVEITSEEKDYSVESAFVSGETGGWRAAKPGPQTIRLVFDQPQKLKQISLVFEERSRANPRVRLAMVSGWRKLISRNCSPAVELQPS